MSIVTTLGEIFRFVAGFVDAGSVAIFRYKKPIPMAIPKYSNGAIYGPVVLMSQVVHSISRQQSSNNNCFIQKQD